MKRWKLSIEKQAYVARSAKVYVSDHTQFGEFNHPSIAIRFEPIMDEPPSDWDMVTVEVEFQRNIVKWGSSASVETLAHGWMDTCQRWGKSYAGSVRLNEAGRMALTDRPFALRRDDKLRVAAMRRLARVCNEYNLYYKDGDVCMQVVYALDLLGVPVEKYFSPSQGGAVPLYEARNTYELGANQRWHDENPAPAAADNEAVAK